MKLLKRFVGKLKYIGASGRGELMWSCMTCDVNRAKKILEIIDNVDFIDDADVETPLTMAIKKDSPEIVKMLIKKGADLNLKNKNDVTPLMYAIKLKKIEILKLLLENGVNTELKDKDGRTPLIYLCNRHSNSNFIAKAIKLLIDYNANINVADNKGMTPLMYLCISQVKREILIEPNNIKMESMNYNKDNLIKYLIKKGANLCMQDSKGKTALVYTIEKTELSNTINILVKNSGYERYKSRVCVGVNLNNFSVEKRELEYIKKSEWYKWQKIKKVQLEKLIKLVKNVDDIKEIKEEIKDEYENLNDKGMLCYATVRELIDEGEMENNNYIIKNCMRIARIYAELEMIENVYDNIENSRDYVINKLNKKLEQTNNILDEIHRFKDRVELGINKEVFDTIDLCKASGVSIKDIRNYDKNKKNDKNLKIALKEIRNRIIEFF